MQTQTVEDLLAGRISREVPTKCWLRTWDETGGLILSRQSPGTKAFSQFSIHITRDTLTRPFQTSVRKDGPPAVGDFNAHFGGWEGRGKEGRRGEALGAAALSVFCRERYVKAEHRPPACSITWRTWWCFVTCERR